MIKKIEKRYDVVVAGGGLSGVIAAVAAAREGCSVMLVERYGFLGGMATAALVNPFMGYERMGENGNKLPVNNAGLFQELLDRLDALGGLHENKHTFNEEIMKLVLDRMIKENKIDVLLHSYLIGTEKDGNVITGIRVVNKSGEMLVEGKVFIDATGDADLSYQAGCEVKVGRDEDGMCQAMTMCCRIGDLPEDRVDRFINKEEYYEKVCGEFLKAKQAGRIKAPRVDVLTFQHVCKSMMHFNSTRVINKSALDAFDLTESEMEGREQVYELYQFMKNNVRGYENSVLVSTGSQIGVRESRRVMGAYVLTEDDLLGCVKFEDSIARGAYMIDAHSPNGTDTIIKKIKTGEYYTVPYRSIVAKGIDNLVVAGRPISTTHLAHSAIRIMPICSSIGEGAGTAAAIAVKEEKAFRDVDASKIQSMIKKNGGLY